MLTLGRALMTNPRVLLLDEATEGLAPLIARDIWRTIRIVREAGMAMVIVDKNFAALSALADRCVILVKGRKVFDASPAVCSCRPKPVARAPSHRRVSERGAWPVVSVPSFVDIDGQRIECVRYSGKAPLVFLHEGLGSVAMWRIFRNASRTRPAAPPGLLRAGYGNRLRTRHAAPTTCTSRR